MRAREALLESPLMFGGFYIVPLYVLIQTRSQKSYQSRVIAANNIINALFMVISAGFSVLNDSHGSAWNQALNLPGIGTGAVEVAGEGRAVFANGATITDSFTPYQLHVYRV